MCVSMGSLDIGSFGWVGVSHGGGRRKEAWGALPVRGQDRAKGASADQGRVPALCKQISSIARC